MIRDFINFIIIVILFQCCNLSNSTYGIWKNSDIEKNKREDLKKLNDKLINSIKNNKISDVKGLMSNATLLKSGIAIDSLVSQGSFSFTNDSYVPIDEYYVRNSTINLKNTIQTNNYEGQGYLLNFIAFNKETYVSLLLVKNATSEYLVTAIYGYSKNKWELNNLLIGPYSIFGQTATKYYQLAKSYYQKSYLIDAANTIFIAKECLKPADDIFHFLNENEIEMFYDKVANEAKIKYHFPLILQDISTKPKILNIYPLEMNEGFYPMICYLSNINIKDTIPLKIENNKIKKEVNHIFNGINKDKKYIFYRVFNEIPDGIHPIHHYGFADLGQR